MKKILVLTTSFPINENDTIGGGNFLLNLYNRLSTEFDIHVLAPLISNAPVYSEINKLKVHRFKFWFSVNNPLYNKNETSENIGKISNILFIPLFFVFNILVICRIINKKDFNIIHAHWLLPSGLIAVIYKIIFNKKIKILATIHGADINRFNGFAGRFCKKFVLNNIDGLTVVSNAIKEEVIKLGYNKEIYVFPMGIDTKLFGPDKRDKTLRIKYNICGHFLLFVGGIIERKGIRYLIQAMPAVIKDFPDTKLLVIGDGNLKNEMVQLIKKLKIAENVIFTGSITHDELPPYFATADLFILPSLSEGFGLVIIEAMSCKTLAVTTNLEVVHDIISENETGFFFKEINKDAISEKIITILQNKEKFENIREKGRQYVIEKFDWNIVKSNYCNLFKNII